MIDIKFMSIEHLKVGFNNFPTIYLKVTKRKVTKRKVTKRKVTKGNISKIKYYKFKKILNPTFYKYFLTGSLLYKHIAII
jgi:hypothetical protein